LHWPIDIPDQFMACPDCDLLLHRPPVPKGKALICPRCNRTLAKHTSHSLDKTLALSSTGLLLYLPAMLLPLMTFEFFGFKESANVMQSILNFYDNGYRLVSLIVLVSAVLLPLSQLLSIFPVSLLLKRGKSHRLLAPLFRSYLHLQEWAMTEIYLLGITITVIKMGDSTQISYHPGLFCFAALVLVTLATSTAIDRELFWQLLDNNRLVMPEQEPIVKRPTTAACEGLISCTTCTKLVSNNTNARRCPRCGSTIHQRKTASLFRTWALVLTAAIFLVPANIFPIMEVNFLGIPSRSTIFDGIIGFFHKGNYGIGLIILIASVLVPLFKIIGLTILLTTTRPCQLPLLQQKARMYRVISFIGRWSMLDIFVIALLTVLVDFGILTSIHTAPAATYFCIVVIASMLAAITFDPRLMWDRCNPCNREQPLPPTSSRSSP
jgi:paraquat-inducible protein A